MQAARIYSTLQPEQDIDKGLGQTHSPDTVRDKFMHISISPALKMRTRGAHYQQAGENFLHLVPGAVLIEIKLIDEHFFLVQCTACLILIPWVFLLGLAFLHL